MADQVGAVDPVDELGLGLQPLHGAGEPARQAKPAVNESLTRQRVQKCTPMGAKGAVPGVCVPGLSGVIDGFWHLKERETENTGFLIKVGI